MDPSFNISAQYQEGSYDNLTVSEQLDQPFLRNQNVATDNNYLGSEQLASNSAQSHNFLSGGNDQYISQGQSFLSNIGAEQAFLSGASDGMSDHAYGSSSVRSSFDQSSPPPSSAPLTMTTSFIDGVGPPDSYMLNPNDQSSGLHHAMSLEHSQMSNNFNMDQNQISGMFGMEQSNLGGLYSDAQMEQGGYASNLNKADLTPMSSSQDYPGNGLSDKMFVKTEMNDMDPITPPSLHTPGSLMSSGWRDASFYEEDEDESGVRKPQTAWELFMFDIQNELKAIGQTAGISGQQLYLTQKWKSMTDGEKQKYFDGAYKDQVRYQAELGEWKRDRGLPSPFPLKMEKLSPCYPPPIPNREIVTPTESVNSIIHLDPEVQEISEDGVAVITKAMELFLAKLAGDSFGVSNRTGRVVLNYSDINEVIQNADYLLFLREDFL